MSASPLDNVLDGQLINAPIESAVVLDSIETGASPPAFPPGAVFASKLARDWYATVLRAPYRPGTQVHFAAFPKEAGRFDVLRARYGVRVDLPPMWESRLEVSNSSHVGSVVAMPTPRERALPCGERIRQVAGRILETSAPLDLVETGRSGDLVYGTPRPIELDAAARRNSFWERDLRWWCSPDTVGFVFLKGDGGMSQVAITFLPDDNRLWFAQYAWIDERDR